MNTSFNLKWVIRGYGKRSVIIHAREIDFSDDWIPPSMVEQLCQEVARLASKQGWKRVVMIGNLLNSKNPDTFSFIFTNISGLTNKSFHKVYKVDIEPDSQSDFSDDELDKIW
jgi:hypothetical protein